MTAHVSKPKAVVKRYIAPNRLAMLVDRPGGQAREELVAEAQRNLESARDASMAAIEEAIGMLEDLSRSTLPASPERLRQFETLADRIITLAETFGLDFLSEAAKRLCDLIVATADRGERLAEFLGVHVRAIRFLAPGAHAVNEQSARHVLAGLAAVLKHVGAPPAKAPKFD